MDDFTKAKDMFLPRNLVMGHGVISRIGEICDDFRFGPDVMMITGDDTYKAAGELVESLMLDDGYNVTVFHTGNATTENVDAAVSAANECNAKFILAVGGGSKIDIGKMTAKECKVPLISIPTSASHDGIASGRASLKSASGSASVDAVVPMAIVADTEIIVKSPYRLLASGCADVISNLTALKDWDLARRLKHEDFSSYAYILSQYAADSIISNSSAIKPNLEESVWAAVKPIVISGMSMSIAGNSRPTSGAEHMFSHALDLINPGRSLHGEQCGVGSIMMMYLHKGDWKGIRNALRDIGAPTNAEELGHDADDVVDALVNASEVRKDRFTILGNGLKRSEADSLARKTEVI